MKRSVLTVTAPHKLVDGAAAVQIMNPPAAKMVVHVVVFKDDRIVGFGFGPPAAPGKGMYTVGWRGSRPDAKTGRDAVPVAYLSAGQLAYCRAWKVDAPDPRGKYLADYFQK